MLSMRQFNLLLFTVCCAVIATAYYLQFIQGALPCCLCVIQRLVLMAIATSFLLCALQKPKHIGLWVYTVLNALLVIIGLAASGRQVWLQNQPTGQQNMCMPTLPSALNHPSVLNALNNLGTHQCAEAGPYFLGLDLSLWTFLFFSLLGAVVLMMPLLFEEKSKNLR